MTGTPTKAELTERISRWEARRETIRKACESMLLEARDQRGPNAALTAPEQQRLEAMQFDLASADEEIRIARADRDRLGEFPANLPRGDSGGAMAYAKQWAQQVAEKLTRSMSRDGETRAVVSGSIDIPSLVETEIVPIARPLRLIDLFPNRVALAGNSFEYYVQTVRTNAATVVPDGQLKPTSTLTVEAHQDRARVIAHLSEPTPVRLWDDHSELQSWLTTEMVQGVLDGLEDQIINGSGTGEDMLGLLATPGTTAVPYSVDVPTTLRSAVTALQQLGEVPDGWALNPVDAQDIDLSRWGTSGGLLLDGYESPTGATGGNTSNIFGPGARRVISNSVPAGTAILGDFTKLRVYVRQDANLAIDASGDLFTKNLFIARGEGRFGIGVLRPSAFAVADLAAA